MAVVLSQVEKLTKMFESEKIGRVKASVYGITYSQIDHGAYALSLSVDGTSRRIPIVIGPSAAQSIAVRLKRYSLPRPLIHDTYKTTCEAFGIEVKEVFITKFVDGVFYSQMTLCDEEREVVLDIRTSDAISIAVRMDSPIFISREVVDKTSFEADEEDEVMTDGKSEGDTKLYDAMSVEALEQCLNRFVENEEYEKASEVKQYITEKRMSNNNITE